MLHSLFDWARVMNQGLSWPNQGWMLDVDDIFLLRVCVCRRSLSVGFC